MRKILSLLTGLALLGADAPVTLADSVGRHAPELLNETWLNTGPLHLATL